MNDVLNRFPSAFRPARLLRGPQLQTMVAAYLYGEAIPWVGERWDTADDDFLDVHLAGLEDLPTGAGPRTADDAPVCLLLHGLGGSPDGPQVRDLARALLSRSIAVVAPHLRGTSPEANLAPRLHHAGETDDVRFLLERLAERYPRRPLMVAGISLGGSMTLNLLGRAVPLPRPLAAAASISAPLDLARSVRRLDGARIRLYTRYLLRGVKSLLGRRRDLHGRAPGVDVDAALAASTIREFDAALIAPLHGFTSADDYYARASAGPVLGGISTPTLILRAWDDPFLDPADLAHLDALQPTVRAEVSRYGGHVGFVGPGRQTWAQVRAAEFLAAAVGA